MKVKIQTKRIYEAPKRGDGFRALVMRLWPRGIRMDSVNLWLRDLGPTRRLLTDFKDKKIHWATFEKRYLEELEGDPARKALSSLLQGVQGKSLTLLCACKDPKRCHATALKKYLMKWTR